MPRNGSGTYSLPQPPFVSGTVISSAAMNSDLSDIASALTGSLPRDGQAGMTGQLKLPDGAVSAPSWAFTTETNTGFFHLGTGEIAVTIQGVQLGFFDSGGWEGPVSGSTPVGMVADFAGSTAPAKWYLCYGQAISRTTYASLFSVIGTTYGSGDGVTTFNVPDFRGRIIAGLDNMGGSPAGRLTTAVFGSDPTVLGDGGGSQSNTLLQSNLPNVAPTFTGQQQTWNTNQSAVQSFVAANQGTTGPGASDNTSLGALSVTVTPSGTISSINGNVSQTAFAIIQPTVVLNKIIYAGA